MNTNPNPPPTPALQPFHFNGQPVRHEIIDGVPWFCLKDVCTVLNIKQPADLKRRLNPKGVVKTHTLTAKGRQQLIFINEANLYKAIFKSEKPEALAFEDWVTGEVLPAIGATGSYSMRPQPGASIDYTDIFEYEYKGKPIRVIKRPDGFWFMAKDLRLAVGLVKDNCDRVKLYGNGSACDLVDFGCFKANVLNEVGAVTMVSRSYKPEARAFKKWLTGTLIPKLRENPPLPQLPSLPATDTAAIKALIVETLTELILNTNAQRGGK